METVAPRQQIRLALRWPEPPGTAPETEFFCGAWHPSARIRVELASDASAPGGGHGVRTLSGDNWWLSSTELEVGGSRRALVHPSPSGDGAFMFRGYSLDARIQGWSDPAEITRAVDGGLPVRANGVYALARILEGGRRLVLATDLFGISPLYIRRWGELVLFANTPRLLSADGDELDELGARAVLGGALIAGRTLNSRVSRADPGIEIDFHGGGETTTPRPGLGYLPASSRPVDDPALDELEARWRDAISRCLALPASERTLALSSGWDSRRILGALLAEGAGFRARTVHVVHSSGYDLDARFARELSDRFGFAHDVIALPGAEGFASMDRDRRRLLDAESGLHTWMLPLCHGLESPPHVVFDGLAGDMLGETGIMASGLWHLPRAEARAELARRMSGVAFDHVIRPDAWPRSADLQREIASWIAGFPPTQDLDLAQMLGRMRRTISVSTQLLLPAGCTAVYPYLDLDYLHFALLLDSEARRRRSVQLRCLERYDPELAAIPGSRSIPSGLPRRVSAARASHDLALFQARTHELRDLGLHDRFLELLRLRPRVQARAGLAPRVGGWWHGSLTDVLLCDSIRTPAWACREGRL